MRSYDVRLTIFPIWKIEEHTTMKTHWLVRLFTSAEGRETRRLDRLIDFWFKCHPMRSFMWFDTKDKDGDSC